MSPVVTDIINLLGQLLRLLGMVVLGLGFGWIALDLLKKIEPWQGQVAIFLGLAGLIIGMAVFTGPGALGGFAIGVGIAIFMWGMPKKNKPEEEKS
jgi:ABC-type phosphate transport system permease subunit